MANVYSTSRAAKVQKFAILSTDFSLPNGELGPTLKLRRPIVAKMYSAVELPSKPQIGERMKSNCTGIFKLVQMV